MVHVGGGITKSCTNYLTNQDIIGYIKVNGHLIRTSENRIITKIFNTKPEGTKKVGRLKLRWEECECQDIRILGVKS
jgi:hypothetical protein